MTFGENNTLQVMYDRSTEAWSLLFSIVARLQERGACTRQFSRLMWASFCRFFRQMLIASKVRHLVEDVCSQQYNPAVLRLMWMCFCRFFRQLVSS